MCGMARKERGFMGNKFFWRWGFRGWGKINVNNGCKFVLFVVSGCSQLQLKTMKTSINVTSYPFSLAALRDYLLKVVLLALVLAGVYSSSANAQDAHPGEAVYKSRCSMCHQANGAGLPNMFPPLAESEWVNGPAENLIKIQLYGLTGPITVKGKDYNGVMAGNATMSDQEIADVLTYVRSHMGNNASAVTADMVKKHRDEMKEGAGPVTVADLIDPNQVVEEPEVELTEPTELDGFKPAKSSGTSGVFLIGFGIIGVCFLPVLAGFFKN